jgi:nicotinamidase-related amidase
MPAKNRDLYGNASDVAPAVLLLPAADDYFVLKPKRSGFFFTTLDILLEYLRARTLILTGLTADDCVLFTASGAYLRDFHLIVPDECVASIDPRHTRQALADMHRVLKAEVVSSTTLSRSGQAA